MIDHRARQTADARRESRALLAEGVSFERFRETAKNYPAGSVWHWATGNVWGPTGSAKEKDRAA